MDDTGTRLVTPGVETEPDAVRAGPIARFGVILTVVCLGALLVVWGFFRILESRTKANEAGPSPVEAEKPRTAEQKLPPAPRLEINATATLARLRAAENERLTSYGWVDKEAGLVRIPIDRAMELLAEREKKR